MSNRIKSLELMKQLRPFTQLGLLSASTAQSIVSEYANGNLCPLKNFIFSPDVPSIYISILQNIKCEFIH